MGNKLQDPTLQWGRHSERKVPKALVWSLIWLAGVLSASHLRAALELFSSKPQSVNLQLDNKCHPPLPTLLAYAPPSSNHPELVAAAKGLDGFLSKRTSMPDIDSLSITVVTPSGAVFEQGYGVLKANSTDPAIRGSVDRDTIYRIASVSKMFATLETLVLRERGVLSWDDPVTKFFPNFTYPSHGWSEHLAEGKGMLSTQKAVITLRQLATHMSGIGRDYPPLDMGKDWPNTRLPWDQSKASLEDVMEAIATNPLVVPTYGYPVYSNTGFALLGLCNVVANQLANGIDGQPTTYKELMNRDVFAPLGMNSSFFRFPKGTQLAEHVAVPSSDSEWSEKDFNDVQDAAGGQYSSIADLSALMKTLLSPHAEGGVISEDVVREWLRPLHPWSDGFQEVGAPWEITKISGETRFYAKGGNLPGYHSQFGLVPEFSYGVIALMTGNYTDTAAIAAKAISYFQPAFQRILAENVAEAYSGNWVDDADSSASISVIDGSLYLKKFIIRGVDVIAKVEAGVSGTAALWSTGRLSEFRIAIGRESLNVGDRAGCEPYWVSIDGFDARGAPVDLIYFKDGLLEYPSADVRLWRA